MPAAHHPTLFTLGKITFTTAPLYPPPSTRHTSKQLSFSLPNDIPLHLMNILVGFLTGNFLIVCLVTPSSCVFLYEKSDLMVLEPSP